MSDGIECQQSGGGDSMQFVASVEFTPVDIRNLTAVGIAFSFAAYPTSDEAGETVNPE